MFIGSKGVSIVEANIRGKAKNYIFSPYPNDLDKPGGTTAPKDNIFNVFFDNQEEIVAFLSKSIRESRVDMENSNFVICIPNRDLIVRFFEIPHIPHKEIATSIGFEMKKYIPFRTEDISYDYQTYSQKNIIEVLFAGIKKEDLEKYSAMLDLLKINVLAIEPAQFSLLRMLNTAKIIKPKEAVVIVELEKEMGSIQIVDNTIPYFSRDIKISSGADAVVDMEALSFRLVNEVRVSIDYFRRQFLKKGTDRIVVLSKDESKELINNFNKELGLPVQFHNSDDIFGIKEEHSLNFAKAMGGSFRASKPSSIAINLFKKQVTPGVSFSLSPQALSNVFGDILDIPKATIIKAAVFVISVLLLIFLFGILKTGPLKKELDTVSRETASALSDDLQGKDVDSLNIFKKKIKDEVNTYKRVFVRNFLISEKLLVLPKLLPEGLWLESINFDSNNKIIVFRGTAYNENDKDARDAPYAFISALKKNSSFASKVSNVSVKSLRSDMEREYKVTRFEIEARLDF